MAARPTPDSRRRWLDRFASTTQLQLGSFEARQLCTVLWSLNCHGYRPRAAWVQAFLQASQHLLGSMSDQQLVATLRHLNQMWATPSRHWVIELVAAARSRSFDAVQESLMEQAVAKLISRMRGDSVSGEGQEEQEAEEDEGAQQREEGGWGHDNGVAAAGGSSSDKIIASA
jgi:hypothetical protein